MPSGEVEEVKGWPAGKIQVLLNAARIYPFSSVACLRNFCNAGHIHISGFRETVIISQYNFSASILGGAGTWYAAASSIACAVVVVVVVSSFLWFCSRCLM